MVWPGQDGFSESKTVSSLVDALERVYIKFKRAHFMTKILQDAMPHSPIRLLCTDFDGTLFDHLSQPCIPKPLLDAIQRLQQRGCLWMVNTGRDKSYLLESLLPHCADVYPDYLGTVERELFHWNGHEYRQDAEWNRSVQTIHDDLFKTHETLITKVGQWIRTNFSAQVYEDPFSPVCLIASSQEEAEIIHEGVARITAEVDQLAWVRNDVYARFAHVSIHKGSVMREVARKHAIGPHAMVAAGDHFNDLPMLDRRYAEHLIVPSNSMPEVIEKARREGGYVANSQAGQGLLEGLTQLGMLEVPMKEPNS